MFSFRFSPVTTWTGVFATAVLLFVACDVPTSGPSLETETGLNTPVIVNKTFSLLGGDKSQRESLIDTTTSQFDSLFTVSESDQSLSIEEEVSSFDIGSLDQALDQATEGVGADTSISETVIQGSDLATQDVDAELREENGRSAPTPSQDEEGLQVANTTIPFPPALLPTPDYKIANIDADRVRSGTLTEETDFNGPVNELTFTLFNDPANPTPLTDGEGNSPSIAIEDENGEIVATASFNSTIGPGDSKSATAGVEGATIGEDSQLVLNVLGSDSDPEDELAIELSPLRYQEATVSGINQVEISADSSNISTREGSGGARFAGIETRSGMLQLDVTNNLQFPIEVDSLVLENNLQGSALPASFEVLDVFRSAESIAPGATRIFEVDLEGRGIASGINARVKGGLADDRDVVTAAAEDNVDVSAGGSFTIGTMFFWPDGEEVEADGVFDFEQDRISFDASTDFVELDDGTLALDDLVSEPAVSFESFTLSFPEITSNQGESLTLQLAGFPREIDKDLSDFRLSPTDNEVEYTLQGTLEETIPDQDNLRVIRFADEVRTDVSVGGLDVQALEARVTPFSVDVTEDANGDGRLDLSNSQEATRESFDGFDGIADRVDGLQLSGSKLNFQITTDAGTDARLYAALQGREGSTSTFLAGKGDKSVPSTAPLGGAFYDGNSQIGRQSLIRFGVEGAPPDDPVVTRSTTLTDENSTVDGFLSTLPTSLRLVARARLTGDDSDRLRLRRPLEFDAGLSVTMPVKLNDSFVVEDTIDADFSSLEDVTDPTGDVTVSTAKLRVNYANAVPLGADATFIVLDENENQLLTLPSDNKTVALQPAPKASDGTADGARSGKTTLDLSEQQLRDLSRGRSLRFLMTMNQVEDGTATTLRATDTIDLSLEAKVKASVNVND